MKAGPFAGGKLGKKRFLLGQGVDCHAFSSSEWVSPEYAIGAALRERAGGGRLSSGNERD